MTFTPLFPLTPYIIFVVAVTVGCIAFYLFKGRRTRIPGVAWLRRGLIVSLVLFLGFGPAVMEPTTDTVRINTDVYLVVDRTGSMAAEDYDGEKPRLDGVRSDIKALSKELSGGRFSVLSYDSSASRQLPLTTDTNALNEWAANLNQELTAYSSGSNMNRVLGELKTVLEKGREDNPFNKQILFIFTDGENTSDTARQSFAALKDYVDGGAVLGYGTEKGAHMLSYDPLLEKKRYIKDHTDGSSQDAISKIDEKELKALSTELGVTYLHRTKPSKLTEVTGNIDTSLVASEGTRSVEVPQLLLWPFAAALALLLVWEATGRVRKLTEEVG